MTITTADIPEIYDVAINGQGYVFFRGEDTYARYWSRYGHTPTFVERQSVQGAYGDDAQAFWMTAKQNDWSQGEQERFFRANDPDAVRRFYRGSKVDVRIPGQVTLRPLTTSLTFAAAASACAGKSSQTLGSNTIFVTTSTNLYEVDASGTITDRGAHGVGATPPRFGLCTDGQYAYISEGATATKIRYWNGASFADFSTVAGVDSLCFLNNTVFGFKNSTGELYRFATDGSKTTVYTWKRGQGTAQDFRARLRAYGGKLAILITRGTRGGELWLYDGSATFMVQQFPDNFYAHEMDVAYGIVFVAGAFTKSSAASNTNTLARPALLFYAGGTSDILWQADDFFSTTFSALETGPYASVAPFDGGVVFNDDSRGVLYYYDASTGGVHTIGAYTVAGDTPLLAASQRFLLHTRNQTTGYYFPDTSAVVSSGTVDSALIDLDSSLSKLSKGVTIEADLPTGSTVDVSYQLDSLTGSYTSLATGITSGTEVAFPANTTGRAISIRVTLNKGSSAAGPTLKRMAFKAAPVTTPYRLCEYWIDCTGGDLGTTPVILRNDKPHPKSSAAMVSALNTAIVSTVPITIIDRFGSYTAEIQADKSEIIQVGHESFLAHIVAREV